MIKKIVHLSSGNLFGSAISFFSIPFILSLYGAEEFGRFGIFSSIVTIISVLLFLRYDQVITITKTKEEMNDIFNLCIILSLVLLLVSLPLLLFVDGFFGIALFAFFCGGITSAYAFLLEQVAIFKEQYKFISITKTVRPIIFLIFSVFCYISNFESGLIISVIITNVFIIVLFVFSIYQTINFKVYTFPDIIILLKKYIEFPKLSLPQGLLFSFGFALPLIIIQRRFSDFEVGIFSFAQKILEAPVRLISGPLINVLKREFVNKENKSVRFLIDKYLKFIVAALLLSYMFFIFVFMVTSEKNIIPTRFVDPIFLVITMMPFIFIRIVNAPLISALTVKKSMASIFFNELAVILVTFMSLIPFNDYETTVYAYAGLRFLLGFYFTVFYYREMCIKYEK